MIREVSTVVVRVAEAVADARDEPPDSFEPLGAHFDVEALERFIESADDSAKIVIELEDCTVVVDGAKNVAVSA